ncbi:Chaperone protein DnaJ [Acinetobacter haemolyticus CIP 64.3 = MTCC 9819]|uniref:J domain-containing protein n=1 Tax=Acinetobacter haemolyticus CIP 64.3 = MTCC 9819 TaxID=1217659 RepID=N9GE63_ACIHA|nr:DnaJ domain-containing protein [Acinetobacter haemolyticus]ENW15399.1 hypothetical protein F927_03132 [Acinetobacter haemolyticus CIP 64.3 = MTCC 9819]EPR90270.1 Chaperone protein DnaJ [Acinetobacter haemolyticus CIP 64.3 = MTCC 9819]QXZ26664.1 DnaJ domain-containing protein [Acinetobacter haemolyticus]SPT46089.1 chaperone protein dnaJ [Acinetobacter haemolyticus]SUU62785.1 chaperone protein dnaJ [Acinetobacter haemolyticus]
MNKLHTYYDNLKVSRTAPLEVIRAAYKILAQKYHPDRNSNNPEAARIMKLINEAYEVLSNPIKRAEHDSWIEAQEEKIRKIQDRNSNKIKNEQNSVDSRSTLTGNKKEILKGFSWLFFITLMGIFVLFLLPEVFSKFSSENEHNYTQNYSSVDITEIDSEASESLIMTYQTSFDCTKAKSIPENLICYNANLAALDRELAEIFHKAREAAVNKKDFTQLVRNQWNDREKNCIDKACLEVWFANQKTILTRVAETGHVNVSSLGKKISPKPLPNTGIMGETNLYGVAPLQIKTPYDGMNYFVKIDNAYTNKNLATYFIQSGDDLNVELPLGSYVIKYAYGPKWYGIELLFGDKTEYAKVDKILAFDFDGYQYSGYTIELVKQENGNLQTTSISKNQF